MSLNYRVHSARIDQSPGIHIPNFCQNSAETIISSNVRNWWQRKKGSGVTSVKAQKLTPIQPVTPAKTVPCASSAIACVFVFTTDFTQNVSGTLHDHALYSPKGCRTPLRLIRSPEYRAADNVCGCGQRCLFRINAIFSSTVSLGFCGKRKLLLSC